MDWDRQAVGQTPMMLMQTWPHRLELQDPLCSALTAFSQELICIRKCLIWHKTKFLPFRKKEKKRLWNLEFLSQLTGNVIHFKDAKGI